MYHVFDAAKMAANIALSNGGLTATIDSGSSGTSGSVGGLFALDPTQKLYFEVAMTTPNDSMGDVGIVTEDFVWSNGSVSWNYEAWGYDNMWDRKCHRPDQIAYGDPSGMTAGDNVGVAIDMPNGDIWFRFNGVWKATGADPANGTNPDFTAQDFTTKAMYLAITLATGQAAQPSIFTLLNSPAIFAYTPPTGFTAPNFTGPTVNGTVFDTRHIQRARTIERLQVITTKPTAGAAHLISPAPILTSHGGGHAALTAPTAQLQAQGTVGTAGAAHLILPPAHVAAQGWQSIGGVTHLTNPIARLSAMGLVGLGGMSHLTLPNPTAAAAGYIAAQGGAQLTLPVPILAAAGAVPARFENFTLKHRRF